MLASLLSYVAGLMRDRVLSTTFGATRYTDAYNASFLIPDLIFNLFIAGALSVAFVPIFTSYFKQNKKEAAEVANTIITFGTLLLSVVGIVLFFTTPYIIPAFLSHVDSADHQLIISMTRIMLLSPILFSVSNALGSILITQKHFLAYALSGFLYNLGIILGILVLSEQFGIFAAAIGAVVGAFFHLFVRLLNIISVKYKYRPTLSLRHKGVKKIFKLMIPKTVSLVAWQLMLWTYTFVAYGLGEGSVAAFNYARNLQSFPVSLFGIAFATAVFPFLADHVHQKDRGKFSGDFQTSLEKILFFAIPAAVGMLILNREIIEIILKGGAFDDAAVNLTSLVLFFFILSIPIESAVHLFARGYYAFKNTLTPMFFALAGYSVNIGFSIFAAKTMGVSAIPIAFLIGTSLQLALLVIFFSKKLTQFKIKHFIIKMLKIGIATGVMALAVIYIPSILSTSFLMMQLFRIAIGGLIFLGIALLLKCKEVYVFSK